MHRPNWIFVTATLILCSGTASSAEELSGAAQSFKPLPSDAMADYQLGGAYDPPAGTNVVVRDSTATPARGLYNICYVNGFQTQPGVAWPLDLLVKNSKGKPLVDPEWPDEHLLDISSEKRRAAILERLAVTISGCARAGFNAVEFDNLDSFTRSNGALKHEDAVAFATLLVSAAHGHGLAAGQKNAPHDITASRSSTLNMSMIFAGVLPTSARPRPRHAIPFFAIANSNPHSARVTVTITASSIGLPGNSRCWKSLRPGNTLARTWLVRNRS